MISTNINTKTNLLTLIHNKKLQIAYTYLIQSFVFLKITLTVLNNLCYWPKITKNIHTSPNNKKKGQKS